MDYIIIESYDDRIEVSFLGSKHTLPYSFESYEVREEDGRVQIYHFEDQIIIFSSPSESTIFIDQTNHNEDDCEDSDEDSDDFII